MIQFNFKPKTSKSSSWESERDAFLRKADRYLLRKYGMTWDAFPDVIMLCDENLNDVERVCEKMVEKAKWYF